MTASPRFVSYRVPPRCRQRNIDWLIRLRLHALGVSLLLGCLLGELWRRAG